jgi:hypothetical protein
MNKKQRKARLKRVHAFQKNHVVDIEKSLQLVIQTQEKIKETLCAKKNNEISDQLSSKDVFVEQPNIQSWLHEEIDVDRFANSKHCDDYVDDETQPLCLRRFLRYKRWPAIYQIKARAMKIKIPTLFANYQGKRIRVVMASRFGDVGITEDLEADHGYSIRVMVEELTDFSTTKEELRYILASS